MDNVRIDRAAAHKYVADGAKLLDVRTPEEFAGGALPGAVNVPVQVIAQTIVDYAKDSETIVLYCRSGARSDVAARILRGLGYANSFNMGGIGEW